MKHILTILLIFVSCAAFAQDPMYADFEKQKDDIDYGNGPHPNKKDNTIILETTDSYDVAFRNIVGILGESGFGLHTINKEYGQITSTAKQIKQGAMLVNLTVRETGEKTRITIRGDVDTNMAVNVGMFTANAKSSIYYAGMKGSLLKTAWNEMEKVARTYENASISYQKK